MNTRVRKPVGLTVAGKFFGLLIILIGILTINLTIQDPPEGMILPFSDLFKAAALVLVAIGIFLVLAKDEQASP